MSGKSLFAIVMVLVAAGLARAQETTSGSIAGQVIDAQGLAVPGATVTLVTPQGPRALTTDSEGRFFAPFLTRGASTKSEWSCKGSILSIDKGSMCDSASASTCL